MVCMARYSCLRTAIFAFTRISANELITDADTSRNTVIPTASNLQNNLSY